MGAVTRPGGYVLNESRQQITVLKALAMAGDVTNVAKKSRITILRRDPRGPAEKREEIPVNYKAMVKGQIADMRLKPDDILFVPESAGLKALHTAVNAAVQVAYNGGPGIDDLPLRVAVDEGIAKLDFLRGSLKVPDNDSLSPIERQFAAADQQLHADNAGIGGAGE